MGSLYSLHSFYHTCSWYYLLLPLSIAQQNRGSFPYCGLTQHPSNSPSVASRRGRTHALINPYPTPPYVRRANPAVLVHAACDEPRIAIERNVHNARTHVCRRCQLRCQRQADGLQQHNLCSQTRCIQLLQLGLLQLPTCTAHAHARRALVSGVLLITAKEVPALARVVPYHARGNIPRRVALTGQQRGERRHRLGCPHLFARPGVQRLENCKGARQCRLQSGGQGCRAAAGCASNHNAGGMQGHCTGG